MDGDKYGKSNIVVTAAHCFCGLTWDENNPDDKLNMYRGRGDGCGEDGGDECIRIPKPGHFFVRIGVIDNNSPLNLQNTVSNVTF